MYMKNTTIKIVFVVVVVAILGFVIFKSNVHAPTEVTPTAQITGDTADFVSLSVMPGATVSGQVTVVGSIKGAYFFEATARGALLDANKNVFKSFPLTATGEWMTSDPVAFTATFDTTGLTGPGFIRLSNDNPSGDPARDKYIDIPVVFQ